MSRFAHYQLVRNIGRSTSRTYFTHFIPTFARASPVFEETPQCLGRYSKRHFSLLTKSRIGSVFSRYAPKLDLGAYIAAAQVFPMRANNFVVEELIDWSRVPDDPIFQLVFPQPGMLKQHELSSIISAMSDPGTTKVSLRNIAESIRNNLNPHPASQKQLNVPVMNDMPLAGMQHKYRETLLFFPTEGQFCHSFCTYCFRWAQFTSVGSPQQFRSNDALALRQYVSQHPQIKDVLFTGGDPMVMPAATLTRYIRPLLDSIPSLSHLSTIRIGTKSFSYWPYRYLSDTDSTLLLRLFEEVVRAGKHLTIQAHFSHPIELENPVVQEAMRVVRMTGAQIRGQGPLVRHVNDNADAWARMWNLQTGLGSVPYYMFVERDTGARHYFSVPLSRAFDIFSTAYASLAGTARTVRGPSMSTTPGKIGILGIETIAEEKVFVLKFWQSRNPAWTKKLFFAQFDDKATWIDDLKPAWGEKQWFWEEEYRRMGERSRKASSGQLEFST